MSRISFIMPTFNRAHLIGESVASVVGQMHAEDELILIDDGSTDGTAEALRPFAGKVRYVRQDNAGKAAALNRAMRMAQGRYVWICDDDDLLRPGAVALLLRAIEASGADFVFGRYSRFSVEGGRKIDMGTGYWPDLSQGSLARHILEDSFVMHNASLVRREAYERCGPFDETMLRSLDYDMFVRLALLASVEYVDAIVFDQRKHPGARGPASLLHSAGTSDAVWQEFDRRIFEKVRRAVSDSYFAGMFASSDPRIVQRAGLLQRACILGRHGLWSEAIADLDRACAIGADVPLQPLEIAIVRRAVSGKHGFSGLATRASLHPLHAIGRKSNLGRHVVEELGRGMLWRLHAPEAAPKRDAIRYLSALGPAGLARILARRLAGHPRPRDTMDLHEITPPLLDSESGVALHTSRGA